MIYRAQWLPKKDPHVKDYSIWGSTWESLVQLCTETTELQQMDMMCPNAPQCPQVEHGVEGDACTIRAVHIIFCTCSARKLGAIR